MIQSHKTGSFEIKPLYIIILFAVLQLFIALLTESLTFTQEEAMWHYIGRNWFRHGLAPYAGGVDNKSPLIFSVFGLSDFLFGVNYWFPRILGTFVQSAGIYYVFKIANHIAGKQAGILAIAFYGFSLLWRSTGGKYVSFTETYAVMFIIVSFYLCLTAEKQKIFFISGLLAGLGFGFRLSAVFGITAIFISSFRKNKVSPIIFLLGVLTSIAILIVLASQAGISYSDFVPYGFSDNFGTASVTDRTVPWKLENFANGFFYSELILFYPAIIGYVLIKKRFDFLTLWLICEFIGIVALGLFARNHFKSLLPPLSLMSAISVNYLIENYKVPVKQVLIIIGITFFPKTWEPLFGLKKLLIGISVKSEKFCQEPYPQPDDQSKRKLGLWIKANTSEKGQVFIAGSGAQLQVYSERLSPTIYFNVTQTKVAKDKFFIDVQLNKPDMILVPKFPEYEKHVHNDIRVFIDKLILQEYYHEQCVYGYDIYQIKKNTQKQP